MTQEEQQTLWKKVVKRSSSPEYFAGHLGMVYDRLDDRSAEGHIKAEPQLCNPFGILHGGVYYSLMDQLSGMLVAAAGWGGVTIDCSVNYIRSAKVGDTVRSHVEAVHVGRSVAVYEGKCWDEAGTLLCTGTFHLFILGPLEQIAKLPEE